VIDRITQRIIDYYGSKVMAYEQREMSGSLFRNEDKQEGDNRPNVKGTALIAGVEYEMAAWTKEGKKGKFQSVSFTRKDDRKAVKSAAKPAQDDDDERIPF
jgi:hypothetical protein